MFAEEKLTCPELCDALNALEESPWGGWNHEGGIRTREIGKRLAPYGVHAKTIRLGDRTAKGYDREQFEDSWIRYLPVPDPSNSHTVTTRMVEPETTEEKQSQPADVTVSESPGNPHEQSDVTVVTVSEAGSRDDRLFDPDRARRFDEMYPPSKLRAVS